MNPFRLFTWFAALLRSPLPAPRKIHLRLFLPIGLFLLTLICSLGWGWEHAVVHAQSPAADAPVTSPDAGIDKGPAPPQSSGEAAAKDPDVSDAAKKGGVVEPLAAGQYVLEFNRSPVVGNRLRLRSIYDETRLRFTRPRAWKPKSAKLQIRFRHSPALYATRSNLTAYVNGASVGSLPLNKKQGEIGSAIFDIPPDLIQDYNEVVLAALQNNSPTCTQDPFDPSLWTEILPDSKLVFNFQPQPIALNFSHYPFPIFDNLSLEPNQLAFLLPNAVDESWLTATTRFQTSLGRFAQYRPMNTRLLTAIDETKPNERLVIIGTPKTQPALAKLTLPLSLKEGQLRDEQQKVLPNDVGVVMLTTTADKRNPVLVATGNSPEGVAKAVQFLIQSRDRQLGTGQAIVVRQVNDVPPRPSREWAGYLPTASNFQLKDLTTFDNKPYEDMTVRGADAPVMEFDFRALPDDQFSTGNVLNLNYSYSPQVNPLTSLVEVQLDGLALTGKKLDSVTGGSHETLRVVLPEDRIKPNSKIRVRFQLDPRERRSCNRALDQQLWGTVHADTSFELNRTNVARLPDLKLLQFGFPFTAPQDLSKMAIVLPDAPTTNDLALLLEVSARLGRLSQSESVKLDVFQASKLPTQDRGNRHLIAIGTRDRFPLPEALRSEGFTIQEAFRRQRGQSQLQTLPDAEGLVKEIVSPWNRDRALLILSGQTKTGLDHVRDLLNRDFLFFQLREDTVLIDAGEPSPNPYDPNAYTLEFLQQAKQKQQISEMSLLSRILKTLRIGWFIIAPGFIIAALLLYAIAQSYLGRLHKKG
ncbi:cellulose biosynthesis cyclic di-GMP-binding regulatory protein BcsB [Stenomitos frigidus]|uniref:Cellulose synthase n=1 Tax=Stenomitos frigidus ULC18 TaxID=2107698 RepID=A0A2T1ECH9_9CYAN|nr:cellulose biosynthesis cyclic di-GMP-binding regulatory protein BcsB [Stenomitos frigidus]PSB30414.1 cellulose synthase [Stenomitos frigidus ULC18]